MKKIIAIALIPIALWLIWSAMKDTLTEKASADIVTIGENEDKEETINIVSWQGNYIWAGLQSDYNGTWVLGKQTLYINGEIEQMGIVVVKSATPVFDETKQFVLNFKNNNRSVIGDGTHSIGGTITSTIRSNWENIIKISLARRDNNNITLNFYTRNGIIDTGQIDVTAGNGMFTSVTNFQNNPQEIDLSYIETIKVNEYEKGYTEASNERLENLTPWGQIKMGVDELFNIPLLGEYVTIGTVIRIGLGVVMVGIIVKLFLGG